MASRGSTSSSNGLLPGATQPDLENGKELHSEFEEDDAASSEDPFDIANTKNAPPETLKRWRVKLCVLIFICIVMWYDVML